MKFSSPGLTLIEVVIGISLIVVIIFGTITGLTINKRVIVETKRLYLAKALAQAELEEAFITPPEEICDKEREIKLSHQSFKLRLEFIPGSPGGVVVKVFDLKRERELFSLSSRVKYEILTQ
jgi:type II secretory pathway pseudopilin PulG